MHKKGVSDFVLLLIIMVIIGVVIIIVYLTIFSPSSLSKLLPKFPEIPW